jgi:D-3-phosphoglycerate dehydrogenase
MWAMKALLLENIHSDAAAILADRGFEVETRSGALGEEELIEALDGVSLLGLRSRTHVTERVLNERPGLRCVGAFCIGTNQIDLAAADERGVAVFNAPYSNTRSVVELAIGEIIALARHLTDQNALMQSGVWRKSATGSHEIRGRVLGIVGYGNIGSQLSVLAESLGMRVIFYDIVDRLALGNARRCETLAELLAEAEVVSLHIDGRKENEGFFGEEEFAQMRERSLFINLCRGFVVDLEALQRALASKHLAGAAIDVFPEEPAANGDPFVSSLQGLDNVILTPHVGGSTQEAQKDIGHFVALKMADFADYGTTTLSVNFPEVHGSRAGVMRILDVHRNVPGALGRLNAVVGSHEVNIAAQQLATRGGLGYVVTDIDSTEHPHLIEELKALPETISVETIEW